MGQSLQCFIKEYVLKPAKHKPISSGELRYAMRLDPSELGEAVHPRF